MAEFVYAEIFQARNLFKDSANLPDALQPWVTDEQWLETLQEPTIQMRLIASDILVALGQDAPLKPLLSSTVLRDRRLRSVTQNILRLKIAQWSPEKQEAFMSVIDCLQKTHHDILRELAKEAGDILCKKEAGQVLGSQIQEYAAEVIGNMHNPGPVLVNKLLALLDWPYESVRRKAEEALRKLGKGERGQRSPAIL